MSSTQIELTGDDLVVTRVFDFPRDVVFAAWTDPEQVGQWWGCGATTSVNSEVDLRVGGRYVHDMKGAYGEMKSVGVFTEVVVPERISYGFEPGPNPEMDPFAQCTVTVEFTALGDRTEVRLTHRGLPNIPAVREHVPNGWGAAFDKLGAHLAG